MLGDFIELSPFPMRIIMELKLISGQIKDKYNSKIFICHMDIK